MALAPAVGMTTGFNWQTENLFDRNPLQSGTMSGKFTPNYESTTQLGPTRENLAKQQHEEDIKNLSAEIAAKETPAAKKEREESGFFSSRSQESELEAQKKELKDLQDKNALEEAVKADKYFLIKSEWDRKVIMAANGETVTVEYPNTKAEKDKDGNYPVVKLEITKSSKLRKISGNRPQPTGKTAAMVKNEYAQKINALIDKYEAGWFDDLEKDHKIKFGTGGRILGGSKTAIEEYKIELARLEEARDRELTSIANKATAAPAPQGLNIEPHTIAIFAPGFCMKEGCCLETAFYTLRTAAKLIEDDAEALVDKDLADQIKANKALHKELDDMYAEVNKMEENAKTEASKLAAQEYAAAYREYKAVVTDSNGNPMNKGPKPDPAKYTAEVYLESHPELLSESEEFYEQIAEKEFEVEMSDADLESAKKEAIDRLTKDAKNYRLLLDHCTFQPTCPEWLEDAGSAIANAASATGEAIASAASWVWDNGLDAIGTVAGAISDGLAYVSDLQTKLNEYIGFEGLCSLNPFGGTLGCANCPMGSKCSSMKDSLLGKIKAANVANDFLKNLKGALGLGDGQLLGNLLKCAAALTGEVSSSISAVESFAIGTGAVSVLGGASDVLNTSALPNWNTKVADCISAGTTLQQAHDAVDLLNRTGSSPTSVMMSNVPGLESSAIDLSKLDNVSSGSPLFANVALGEDKYSRVKRAQGMLPQENPSGSTKYYDGRNVDLDTPTKRMKEMKAAGLAMA